MTAQRARATASSSLRPMVYNAYMLLPCSESLRMLSQLLRAVVVPAKIQNLAVW